MRYTVRRRNGLIGEKDENLEMEKDSFYYERK